MKVILALIICIIVTILNIFIFKRLNKDVPDDPKDAEKDTEIIALLWAGIVLCWIFLMVLSLI
jgi:heme/copper-type cytochrome/quinol oxidase subunit 2